MKQVILFFLSVAVAATFVGFSLRYAISLPVVVVGEPSGQCMHVSYGGTCEELPNRYLESIRQDGWKQ